MPKTKKSSEVLPGVYFHPTAKVNKYTANTATARKNRREIATKIADETGLNKYDGQDFLELMGKYIAEIILRGEDVPIPGVGTITTIKMPAHIKCGRRGTRYLCPPYKMLTMKFELDLRKNIPDSMRSVVRKMYDNMSEEEKANDLNHQEFVRTLAHHHKRKAAQNAAMERREEAKKKQLELDEKKAYEDLISKKGSIVVGGGLAKVVTTTQQDSGKSNKAANSRRKSSR